MSNVKWIKLSINMFEDEKIRLIEQMPDADTILIIWVKLLSQAGKTNANGYIFLSEHIPYTDEMLATIFNRPLNTIRLALKTFEQFGMIEIDENSYISITNWGRHQSLDGLDKVRQQTRERVARHRENRRLENNITDVTLHSNDDVTHKEEDKEIDKEKEIKDIVPYRDIVSYLNEKCNSNFRPTAKDTQRHIKARWKEGYCLEDFKKVIDIKARQWLNDPRMVMYLRPATLFGTKFESYLNEKVNQHGQNRPSYGQAPGKSVQDVIDAAERDRKAWGGK